MLFSNNASYAGDLLPGKRILLPTTSTRAKLHGKIQNKN